MREEKNNEQEIYRIKLKKKPLSSEREEIRVKKAVRNRKLITVIIAVVLVIIGFEFGLLFGISSTSRKPSEGLDSSKLEEIAYYFENYWLYADDYEDLTTTLYDQALYGMTTFADDPYTTYASVDDMEDYNNDINVEFVGIGVTYRLAGSGFVITKVYEGSPAQSAGLEPGDIIKAVDGKSTEGMSTQDLQDIVLGKEDTAITFDVLRDGHLTNVEVVRGNVDSSVYAYALGDVAVLELYSFGLDTYDDCVEYLDELKDYEKLIIDLRDNGGGYASAVEEIAGLFLPEGSVVMREFDKDGKEIVSKTNSSVCYDNFTEIIILTNSNTASAAEVLTMALKEGHPNTHTLGETTYGKGVVQSLLTLSDGSTLRLTSMYWTSPNKVSIHETGIDPDYDIRQDDVYYEVFYPLADDTVLDIDSVSEYTRLTQEALAYIGYDVDRTDGYFSESTKSCIQAFLSDYDLEGDGTLDKESYEAIMSVMYGLAYGDQSYDEQFMGALEIIDAQD